MVDKFKKVGPDIKSGDEFKPLQQFNTYFPVHVFVLDIKDDNSVIRHGKIDYANRDHRSWLGRLSFWAMSNGYSVETVAAKDVEREWIEEDTGA